MKPQTKLESLKESLFNTFTGTAICFIANCLILPLFGMPFDIVNMGAISIIFTAISICRGYIIRRYFNKKQTKQ